MDNTEIDVVSEVVEEILKEIDNNSSWKTPFDYHSIRKACSIASVASSDAGDLSTFSDDEFICLAGIESDSDSEVEFEKYLNQSATHRRKVYTKEHQPQLVNKRARTAASKIELEDEYEKLCDLDSLSIKCKDAVVLNKFGSIVSIIGSVAVIKPCTNITLDLDSIIFDQNKVNLGPIVDVFGTVKEPQYCIRKIGTLNVGMEVFIAQNDKNLTKTLLDANMKSPWQKIQVGEKVDDDEIVFSDDEKEKEYQRSKKQLERKQVNNRKRPNNNRVHFNCPDQQGNRNQNRWNWNKNQKPRQYEYPSDMDSFEACLSGIPPVNPSTSTSDPQPKSKPYKPRRTVKKEEPDDTPAMNSNPYKDFGCYDSFLRD